jgi:hypothetical protein
VRRLPCTGCSDACLAEPDVAELVRCIRLCLDCSDLCAVTARIVTRQIALPGMRAFAFEPAVAVDSPGTVGLTWYDLRNDRPGDSALTTDVWFAHSDDGGASWRQTHVRRAATPGNPAPILRRL